MTNCQTKCNDLSKIPHARFLSLKLYGNADLTAFDSIQRPVLYSHQDLYLEKYSRIKPFVF